ncbi:glucan biosynthesis protein G [Sinimarinibacterium flocculans]|nr:glucan biosynthesis protein G [Sinimarinibacterium flocculans]
MAFGLDDVDRLARERAASPYRAPDNRLPAVLANLTHEAYAQIRYRDEQSVWHRTKLPFELQFLHPGMGYDRRIRINIVSADGVHEVPFRAGDFDYGGSGVNPDEVGDIGFAGLRVHYPVDGDDRHRQVLAFHGASFFRALGRGQRQGLSARGLAVDTGELSGEEFPQFTEFWIEWPRPQDHVLTIYALLDSPRMTGAYRFRLAPGETTETLVGARLHFRADVAKLGIAPLTSMHFYGENQPRPPQAQGDHRPEVHDSDGLSIHAGDEWIWRPLTNPRRLFITAFGASALRGFGLMQRDRAFAHYEDLDARFDLRPSAWIEPRGDWGRGRVELVAIPTPDETNDNIVAFWVPERAPRTGDALSFEYALKWQMQAQTQPPLARVVQTRRGHGTAADDSSLHFHIDFEGPPLQTLAADTKPVAGVWVGDGGELLERSLRRNDVTGGWRLSLRVRRDDDARPLEMRAILRDGERTLSETWAYALPPSSGR